MAESRRRRMSTHRMALWRCRNPGRVRKTSAQEGCGDEGVRARPREEGSLLGASQPKQGTDFLVRQLSRVGCQRPHGARRMSISGRSQYGESGPNQREEGNHAWRGRPAVGSGNPSRMRRAFMQGG